MIFEQIEVGNMQNFSYIIADEESKESAIVDAGWEPKKLIEAAKSKDLKIKYILLTHTHYDHVNSLGKLFEMTNAKIIVHEADAKDVENLGLPYETVKDKDEINIGKLKIKIEKSSYTQLLDSMSYLTKNMDTMLKIFKDAAEDIDTDDPSSIKEKLDKIIEQNKVIADGMVAISGMVKNFIEEQNKSELNSTPKPSFTPTPEPNLQPTPDLVTDLDEPPIPQQQNQSRQQGPVAMPSIPFPSLEKTKKKKGLFGRFIK